MNNDCLLRTALGLNALFSLSTGIAMATFPSSAGTIIGLEGTLPIMIVGIGLVFYGAILLFLARGGMPTVLSLIATLCDFAWTVGTLLLLGIAPNLFSVTGWSIAILVASIVSFFALMQLLGIWKSFVSRNKSSDGKFHICFSIPVAVTDNQIWSAIREIEGIHKFSLSLRSSILTVDAQKECTLRTCVDIKGKRWIEEIQVANERKELAIRFRADATDFPFPVTSMSGGWRVQQSQEAGQAVVLVWWNFSLVRDWTAPLLLPLFEMGLKSQMVSAVANMVAAVDPKQSTISSGILAQLIIGGC